MKAFVYPEYVHGHRGGPAALTQRELIERPGKALVSDNQGRDHRFFAELAPDKESHFLGACVTTYANLGAYLAPFGCFVPTESSDRIVVLYKTSMLSINVKGVATDTTPVCAYRGAGRRCANWWSGSPTRLPAMWASPRTRPADAISSHRKRCSIRCC